jgi:L-threonylcarbamoyladenylate synthase
MPSVQHQPRYLNHSAAAAAPGMLLKHYAPRAAVQLFSGAPPATRRAMQQHAQALIAAGERVGLLIPEEDRAFFADLPLVIFSLGAEADPAQMGAQLFAGLRALDAAEVSVILVRELAKDGIGLAIWDRLVRAAAGKIIPTGEN